MFYSHEILQRRGGKFSVIWLAATREKSLSKRDFFSVHVEKACEEIVAYITLRKANMAGSKERFSLYLSSQLMFGITKVHCRQMEYLLGEARRLHKSFASFRLVAAEHLLIPDQFQLQRTGTHTACTLPEPSMDLIISEPYFGDLGHLPSMEGLYLPEEREEFVSMMSSYLSPDRPFMSPEAKLRPLQRNLIEDLDQTLHQVSNIDDITMKEEDQPIRPQMEYIGEELLPPVMSALEDMMEVPLPPDMVQEQEVEQPQEVSSPRPDKVWTVDESTGKLMLSPGARPTHPEAPPTSPAPQPKPIDVSPSLSPIPAVHQVSPAPQTHVSPVMMSPIMPVAADTATEITGQQPPHQHQFQTPAEPTEVPFPILRLAALEESTPIEVRISRKRKLVFADEKIQLTKDQMRDSMRTADDLMQFDVIANPHPQMTVQELFQRPARKALKMSDELFDQWKSTACPCPYTQVYDPKAPAWSTSYLRAPERIMSSSSASDKDVTPERARFAPHEVSASPERVRAAHSKDESDLSRTEAAKFEDTPSSLVLSDLSRLSDTRGASRLHSISGDQSLPLQRSRLKLEEGIAEENFPDQELIQAEEVPPPSLLDELQQLAPVQEIDAPIPEAEVSDHMVEVSPQRTRDRLGDHTGDHMLDHVGHAEISTSEDEIGGVPQAGLFRQLQELLADGKSVTFQQLVPLTTEKKIAAKIFAVILEYGALRLIKLSQSRPYADIKIRQRRP